MSVVSWITPRGILGTVPENEYYSFQLQATDSDSQPLFYSFISGELPAGVYITRSGELRGIPTILSSVGQKAVYSFTIRVTNPNGTVADRSFSLNVNNIKGPQIIPRPDLIGSWFDGSFLDYTFESINDNPSARETWSVIAGELPPGVTFTRDGRIFGYLDIIANNTAELGFEAAPIETTIFDVLPISKDRFYNFTVQVTDGAKFDTVNVRVLVVSKNSFTADNAITLINNSFITIDISADDKYRPIILNPPTSLPTLVAGSIFAYKFLAYDPQDEDVSWAIEENANSGMDELDAAIGEVLTGLGSSSVTVGFASTTSRVVVFLNDVRLTGFTDYTLAGSTLTFTTATPTSEDVIFIQYIQDTTGFDSLKFDQGSSTIPSGLRIDARSGWIIGTLPLGQEEDIKTYEFNVQAYRTFYPQLISKKVTFILNVKRSLNEEIIWNTPADLGTIENGAISEIEISATNTLGKELQYSIVYEPYKRTPQGLRFLKTGRFTGRVTFRYFTLDGTVAVLNIQSAEDLAVGMTVQGVGVAAGCEITAIIDSNTIEVRPAIYVTQGSILTFTNSQISKSVSTTSNAISTNIDSGGTTFDRTCGFTVKAQAKDASISSIKTFTIRTLPRNLAPYENVYLKALPKQEQREALKEILEDTDIFPTELLYRPDDPYFGLQKNLKFLFLPGLSTSTAADFVSSIANNHYFKSINFGDVKTARAVDSVGNVSYEVVYVDVVDTQSYATAGPPLKITPSIKNKFLYDVDSYSDIYPNSFPNMKYRLESGIGYSNRGSLPTWMTSVQEDGRVLGLTRGVVLAYTQPDASKLVAYRLAASGFEINSISFVADRYQWDNYLSKFYNTTTNTFEPSRSTTFDRYPTATTGDLIETTVQFAVGGTNSITIQTNINVGFGWIVSGRDSDSSIPLGTTITAISKTVGETVLTLSNNVTASAGAAIRIDGKTNVDYAVFVPYTSIDGSLLGYVRSQFFIDGTANFSRDETIVFAQQEGFFDNPASDGWVNENGTIVPGYLEKTSNSSGSVINQRGGVWKITWQDIPTSGFDADGLGFDQVSPGLYQSRFDQGSDSEVRLEFVKEIILRQTVKVRTGRSYPQTTLEYTNAEGRAVPSYRPFNFIGAPSGLETTFDGGTCVMRTGYTPGTGVSAGGTTFSSNRDKYIIPESEDKYIKFPQTGVFV
jgi:hypothetical protein